jgi:type I restriction enzyme R subunit
VSYETCVKSFFDRARFLRVLRDYIIFLKKDDKLSKVILRQHQTRAVSRVLDRVYDPTKRRGLIWHTQGSGKTLTMITIAEKLLRAPRGDDKPLVLMLVDRNELEQQLFKNIESYGITTVAVADSKNDLRQILASDYRGLVVSTIHKFDDIPANINPRAGVVVLVDEAHRTTGGDLGNYLMGALPNATYIGFTGTPIDRLMHGEGTFKVFGKDDETGYLDKYSIAESIADGTTVQLNYALAPSDLRVDRATLEREFLDLQAAEGISDVAELNAILDHAVVLKEMLKSPDRMDKVARAVAEHFTQNVEPMGFKAFLVAVDREACALYKALLDKYLPSPDYATPVYSPAHNDAELLQEHYLNEEDEKAVRRAFTQKKELPKILIVTEKLLTGFDAPILYCMYLDKPMRDHVLVQAIARVNRPYEDDDGLRKPCGFVLDFVGIFEKLEKALAFDSDVVASVIQNVDVLRESFKREMRETAPPYLQWARGRDDKAKERAAEHFKDKKRREAFYRAFKHIQTLYTILSPDPDLRPFIEDYQLLAELYGWVRAWFEARPYRDDDVTEKTKRLLREHTAVYDLRLPDEIRELGPRELAALKTSDASDTVKALNLSKALVQVIENEGGRKPFLLPIGERAEAVRREFENRQITTQHALVEFEKLAEEYIQAGAEQTRTGLDGNAYAIFKTLTPTIASITPAQAQALDAVFTRFPDYQWNEQQKTQLRASLYQALLTIVGKDKIIAAANALLSLRRV